MGPECEFAAAGLQARKVVKVGGRSADRSGLGYHCAVTHRIVIAALLIVVGLGIGAFSWHAEDAARARRRRRKSVSLDDARGDAPAGA
jgi:hypothetical protein